MKFAVVTLFPEMFSAVTDYGVTGRAVKQGLVEVRCFNPRDYTEDKHSTVDARPYGGGPGMLMMIEPLERAVDAAKNWIHSSGGLSGVSTDACEVSHKATVVYLSPQGKTLNQGEVRKIASYDRLVLIAGRYEGVDERFIESVVDEEWSVGDYVLSGGELPAMTLIDSVTRVLPGVLGDGCSASQDSFEVGLLDCPHFTRPETYNGKKVPDVLLSGDHRKIAEWRAEQAIKRTVERRPDLLEGASLSELQAKLVEELERGLQSK